MYDEHTICINVKNVEEQVLKTAIVSALNTIDEKSYEKISKRFFINYIVGKYDNYIGVTYVWFEDIRIFRMITGLNADGSKREEIVYNMTWKPSDLEDSWADLEDEEDRPIQEIKTLEPLLKICLPDDGKSLKVKRAFVNKLDNRFNSNILYCLKLPEGVKTKDIKRKFNCFSTSGDDIGNCIIDGKKFKGKYPLININKKRAVTIVFSPYNHDAQFALKMAMKVIFHVNETSEVVYFTTKFVNKKRE
jgi:hypothetical protein